MYEGEYIDQKDSNVIASLTKKNEKNRFHVNTSVWDPRSERLNPYRASVLEN